MAITVEVIEIGDSLGIILPCEVLEKLRVDKGDTLFSRLRRMVCG